MAEITLIGVIIFGIGFLSYYGHYLLVLGYSRRICKLVHKLYDIKSIIGTKSRTFSLISSIIEQIYF